MKILIYTDCFYLAGSERFPLELLRHSLSDGDVNIILSYRFSKKYQRDLEGEGIPITATRNFYFPDLSFQDFFNNYSGDLKFLYRAFAFTIRIFLFYPLYIYQVWRFYFYLRSAGFDLVHINNGGIPGALSCRAMALACKLVGLQCLMTVNNLPRARNLFFYYEYLTINLASRCVDAFITSSDYASKRLKEYLDNIFEMPRTFIVLRNGINLERLIVNEDGSSIKTAPRGAVNVGYIGNLEERKGVPVLLRAVKILTLTSSLPQNVRFVVYGNGPEYKKLGKLIISLGLESIVFIDPRRHLIRDILKGIDVLVVPSVGYEDFPNIVLEGMATGKLVIGSNFGGISEQIVHQHNGLLFESGNPAALACSLSVAATDQTIRDRVGRQAQRDIWENYAMNVSYSRYIDVLRSMTKPKGSI